MRFIDVFTTAPACTPSRTALANGIYQIAIEDHHMRYPENLKNPLPKEVIPVHPDRVKPPPSYPDQPVCRQDRASYLETVHGKVSEMQRSNRFRELNEPVNREIR